MSSGTAAKPLKQVPPQLVDDDTSTSAATPLQLILAFLPPIWALLLLAISVTKALRRRRPGRIQLDEAQKGQDEQKPLFSVFIEDEDILAAEGVDTNVLGGAEDVQITGEAVLPPPSLALVLIPLLETVGWSVNFLLLFLQGGISLAEPLAAIGRAVAWLFVLLTQMRRRSATAPLSLLSLYVILLVESVFGLAQQARAQRGVDVPLGFLLDRLPDLLLIGYLIAAILQMPLNAPLDIAVRLAHGGSDEHRPRSPEDSNTVLGAFTYSWMSGLMSVALSRPLRPMDVWALAMNNRADVLSRRFKTLRSKTLTRKLLRASARDIAIDASLKLVASTFEYLRPFFIQKILENLALAYRAPSPTSLPLSRSHTLLSTMSTDSLTPIERAYLFTLLAFLSMLVKTLAQQRHFHYARRIGMRLRSELTVAVLEKALRRREAGGMVKKKEGEGDSNGKRREGKVDERESASVGKVVSMISEDVNRVLRMGCDSHLIYGAPLEIALGVGFLYNLMGPSAFFGFLILALAAPVNYYLGKYAVRVVQARSTARDARQTSLQELLTEIRTIKLFGWSKEWIERVEEKRKLELTWAVRDWVIRWLTTLLWVIISLLVPLASFWAFVKLQKQELTVAIAFTALSLFSLIRGPLNQIPGFFIRILQLRVSIARLEAFFAEDEIAAHATLDARNEVTRLALVGAVMRYAGAADGKVTLRDVTVEFPEGLTVVSGPTGSGKTSLLLGLLGELEIVSGTAELPSSVSYAAQQPWLESLSVKDNILFGYAFDTKRYKAVLRACALEPDLSTLPQGDQTFVGERGVSLSGGQKARLALARAIYAPTTHVLLDDVLAAVDAHTARHLLDLLFDPKAKAALLQGRTVVLVTHHVHLVLPYAAYRIDIEEGKIVRQGKVEGKKAGLEDKAEEELERKEQEEEAEVVHVHSEDGRKKTGKNETKKAACGQLEKWAVGEVKGEMYKTYLSSSGYFTWALVVIFLLSRPAFSYLEQFWLRRWGEASDGVEPVDSGYFLTVYALIGSATALNTLFATVFTYIAALRGSRSLFRQLLDRVVHAPLRWFDVVPLGMAVNRFTNDIGIVDDALATNISEFGGNMVSMVASLAVVSFVLPAALVSSLVFAIIYANIFRSYLIVNRDVNRIASTTASPLFSSFAETLRGIATIRAFRKQKDYRAKLCHIVDETLAFWYLGATLDVWLSIRTQILSAFCLLATANFATYTRVSPGLAGIAITSSQSVILALDWLCGAYGRLVLSMNGLERITEYLQVPQEPRAGQVPPAAWPSAVHGQALIVVDKLVVRYSPELPPVLHGVSFEVKAGEHLGIVGRTGSGKSTLATSLLRFTEPASGRVIIDGLDITSLSIDHLRQRMTLVPQDVALFAGTIRENLDPLGEHSDVDCWAALKRVHLLDSSGSSSVTATLSTTSTVGAAPLASLVVPEGEQVATSTITLDTVVTAGGTNWSAGQRQLLALARALLRNSRIVVLDESSAALDHALDTRLQEVIREEFRDATVLTIAHRLHTVLDSDRILVLDAGRIVELDTPGKLLEKEEGVFRRMWGKSSGNEVADEPESSFPAVSVQQM
ncbi:hypothetical protein JCM11251_001410 [Rhodosporidiobolus azoricus]